MMKRVYLASALALVVLAGSAVQAEEREVTTVDPSSLLKYELTEEGSLSVDQRISFMYDSIMVSDDDSYTFLSVKGDKLVENLANVDYLGGDLYEVSTPYEDEDVNTTGLVTAEGEILIPCEAASIKTPGNREDGIRFLEIIYTTGTTDNEDECFIYFTDSMISLSVGENDVMYKGYARIYDTKLKQFVGDLEFTTPTRYGFYDLGNSFAYEEGDNTIIYDADGKELWRTSGYVEGATYNALAVSTNGKHYIVDASGKDSYVSSGSLDDCIPALDYFKNYDSETSSYQAIDMEGNPVLEGTYYAIHSSFNNNYDVVPDKDSEEEVVVASDGTVVAEDVDYCTNIIGGYGYIELNDDETYLLATPSGVYDGLQSGTASELLFGKNDDPVILNTGETIDFGDEEVDGDTLAPGLLKVEKSSSNGTYYGLYDLFTGEELLPVEYDRIEMAGEYILAGTTNSTGNYTWNVYHTKVVTAD